MSNTGDGAERRREERRALRVPARVSLGPGQVFEVRTLDVSPSGLGIVASANPRPGLTFKIEFVLPMRPSGALNVEATAKVMHSVLARDQGGFKIGLQFASLSPGAEAAIQKFVNG
ncbi:MAG: PilZ domain-containing protein [Rubrivivax sp.]